MITVVRLESSVQMEDSENIAVTSETKVISDQVSAVVNYHVIISLFQFLYFSHFLTLTLMLCLIDTRPF